MRPMMIVLVWVLAGCGGCSVVFFSLAARAQAIVGFAEPARPGGHVHFAPEGVDVFAGRPNLIDLRFYIDEGFHVNSNKPSSDLLIPTIVTLDAAPGLRVLSTEYPKGEKFRLAIGAGETLDVYQKEFRVRVQVVPEKGESTLRGTLHYQACDNAACYPPKTLPVTVMLHAK